MNAKDCDSIGYVLAEHEASESVREQVFALDPRIKGEYEAYRKVLERDSQVTAAYERRLVERFGPDWCIKKACTSEICHEFMEEARKEVYGEDYSPALFR